MLCTIVHASSACGLLATAYDKASRFFVCPEAIRAAMPWHIPATLNRLNAMPQWKSGSGLYHPS